MVQLYETHEIVKIVSRSGVDLPSWAHEHLSRYITGEGIGVRCRGLYMVPEQELQGIFDGMGWPISLDQFLSKIEEEKLRSDK